MLNTPSPTLESPKQSLKGWPLGLAALILLVLYALGAVVRGELGQVMVASAQTVPFVILAMLAYLGVGRTWAKVLALLWLGLLIAGFAFGSFAVSLAALLDGPLNATGGVPKLLPGAGPRLLFIALASLLAVGLGALGFVPGVRAWLSRFLPLDPRSFVQMVALVAVVALMLLCFIPLLGVGAPPLLNLIAATTASGGDLTAGRSDNGMLRDTVYGLLWTVPGAILAVGFAIQRDLRAALVRLGLVRPTLRQVLAAIGLAAALVAVATALGFAVDGLWDALGWAKTDNEAFGELLDFAINPIGAIVIGVTAGLGEELAVRGVLQPRMGILLSNLFFISLHAFQYNWNTLVVIFVVGLTLGIIRKRTNTTTSAIVHGLYDFFLIMLTVLNVPGF